MQPSPPLKPDACNLTTPNGDIPNLSNCSEYFTCDNGLSILRTCPTGLYFNNDTKYCDFPRSIKTGPCQLTSVVTTTSSTNITTTTTTRSTRSTLKSTRSTLKSTRSTESTRSTRKSTRSTTPVVETTRPTKPTDKKTTTKRQTTHKRLMVTDRYH